MKKITVRIDDDVHDKMLEYAETRGLRIGREGGTAIVARMAISSFLSQYASKVRKKARKGAGE